MLHHWTDFMKKFGEEKNAVTPRQCTHSIHSLLQQPNWLICDPPYFPDLASCDFFLPKNEKMPVWEDIHIKWRGYRRNKLREILLFGDLKRVQKSLGEVYGSYADKKIKKLLFYSLYPCIINKTKTLKNNHEKVLSVSLSLEIARTENSLVITTRWSIGHCRFHSPTGGFNSSRLIIEILRLR